MQTHLQIVGLSNPNLPCRAVARPKEMVFPELLGGRAK